MTKIALVKVSCINDRLIPLGLACLQGYLKQNSIPVKVFNFRTTEYKLPKAVFDPLIQLNLTDFVMNHQDFPLLLPIANDILEGKIPNLSEGFYPDLMLDYANRMFDTQEATHTRFRATIEYCKTTVFETLKSFSTVAFSINYLNIPETVVTSCFLKLNNPDCKIVWGGPSITQSFETFKMFLSKRVCDGLVIGEGEQPLLEISQGKDFSKIKGVISLDFKANKKICYSPGVQLDLDSLPTPDYTDIPLDTYFNIASTYRSRGCTNRCKFCAEWKLFGPRFRTRSVEKVVQDIETIVKKNNPGFMLFGESLINDDLDYFEQLCDALIDKNLNIKFGTHFRANITPKLAIKAKLAGFEDAWVGFEAFSDEDLKEMNKGTSVHQNMETIENLTQAGVNVIAMLVVGFSNLNTELNNCESVINTIKHYSNQKRITENGKQVPLPIQFRPAPMYLVPSSFDYKEKIESATKPWGCKIITRRNRDQIKNIEAELSEIPYSFKRPIPNQKVVELIRRIQETDRNAGFTIGGAARYVIDYVMEERRQNRKARKAQRIGVSAQRFDIIEKINTK